MGDPNRHLSVDVGSINASGPAGYEEKLPDIVGSGPMRNKWKRESCCAMS
jgi:hypothetical protein